MKAALLLVTLLGTGLAFQNPQEPSPAPTTMELERTDGETMTGSLVSLENGKVKLKVAILGGSMVVTNDFDDFEPKSKFRIEMAAKPPTDFEGHLAMAQKAAELGLRERAGDQARAAIKKAKGLPDEKEKTNQVRAWAAGAVEKMVKDAVADGKLPEARRCLQVLSTRLADQRTEEQIDAIAAIVEGLDSKVQADAAAKRQKKLDEQQRAAIDQKLKPITADVEKGTKSFKEAVRKSRQTAASTKLCESAIDSYKKAHKALQTLVEKNPDDVPLALAANSLGREMHDNAIRAGLHAANMRTIQGDFKDAYDWTNRVLAFDPDNAEAKEMLRTIALAEADSADWIWGWGWRVVDDRPRPKY